MRPNPQHQRPAPRHRRSRGGVVQAIYSSEPLNVSVLDRDNWKAEEDQTERDYLPRWRRNVKPCPKSFDLEERPMFDLTYQRVRVMEPALFYPTTDRFLNLHGDAVRGFPPMCGTVVKCSPRSVLVRAEYVAARRVEPPIRLDSA